jgi:hypothetical protein
VKRHFFLLVLLSVFFIGPALACPVDQGSEGHEAHKHAHEKMSSVPIMALKAEVTPQTLDKVGNEQNLFLRLTNNDKSVDLNQLKEVNTRKIHLLVVDSTLTDYHHVHPVATKIPGEYRFSFTPQKKAYRIWADVTPEATGQQVFLVTNLGDPEKTPSAIKTLGTESTVGGYTFRLTLQDPLVVGQPAMASVDVTDKTGKPVTTLQPVMGAFAHVVGFSEDLRTIAHIHPMGSEPKTEAQRGGPTLSFHLEPKKAGFLKLFVQTRIGDQDLFAPFGVTIADAAKKEREDHHHD